MGFNIHHGLLYLSKASSSSIHIEWEAELNQPFGNALNQTDSNAFIEELLDYWDYKWNKGCLEYNQAKCLEGDWDYESFDDQGRLAYKGSCMIEEQAGSLKAKGIRKETYIDEIKRDTYILWETNIMHKYSCGNELCLITSHDCYPQGSRLGLSAFMKLTLESGDDSLSATSVSNGSLRLVGTYFVSGQSDDELFQARSGRIVFTRQISDRTISVVSNPRTSSSPD